MGIRLFDFSEQGIESAFTTIQPDAGTSPVADGGNDVLTLTSSDNSITITGNATTDTIDFVVASSPTLSFTTINTPNGTDPVADASTDTLNLTSTGNTVTITGDASTDTVNFEATPTSIGVLSFATINAPNGTDPVADSPTDTLNLTSTGGSITITGDSSTDTINFDATPTSLGVLSFTTIDCPLGTDPVADSATDTLTLTSTDSSVAITGTAASDSINFSATAASVGATEQAVYNASNPARKVLNATNGGLNIRDAATPIGASLFSVQDNAATLNYLTVDSGNVYSDVQVYCAAGITSPDATDPTSEAYGDGASNLGTAQSIAIGPSAAGANNSVAIGYLADAQSTGIAIGDSTLAGDNTICIGKGTTGVLFNVVIGNNATAGGFGQHVVIGRNASCSSAATSVAIGDGASDGGFTNAFAMGANTVCTAAGQFVFGVNPSQFYLGRVTGTTAVSNKLIAVGARTGTNVTSGGITFAGGIGTGTGARPSIIFQTAIVAAAGTTAHTLGERFRMGELECVFNESALDNDLRVEALAAATSGIPNKDNLLQVDAGLGVVAVGRMATQTTVGGTAYTSPFQVSTDTAAVNGHNILAKTANATAAAGAAMAFRRSKGSFASQTAVTTDDSLGMLRALGHDGTDYEFSSQIDFEVDSAVSANVVPGRLVFRTANTSGALTDRLRIRNAEVVFNEPGNDIDFRIESDTNANMFVIDAGNASGAGSALIAGSTGQIGVFGATPASRTAAYTQTYSTADRTHANFTSATLTDSSGGTANTTVAAVVAGTDLTTNATINDNFADLTAQHNALRVDLEDLKQLVNSMIDDMQTYGWFQ